MVKNNKKRLVGHGGYREGAGRPRGLHYFLKRDLLNAKDRYVFEPIVVMRFSHGQDRRYKTTRYNLAMERLYQMSMGNDKEDVREKVRAIHRWLNLAIGRPKRPKQEQRPKSNYAPFSQAQFERNLTLAYGPNASKYGRFDKHTPEETLTDLQKPVDKSEKTSLVVERPPQDWLKERLEKINSEKDYFIDENGRIVLTERAWKRANASGLSKYLNNKEKSR